MVPLSSTALEVLTALNSAQEQEGIHTGQRDVSGARRVLSKKRFDADFEAMASWLPVEWVFPSASSTGHLSGDVLADAMLRLSARLEFSGGAVRPHDARRTFSATAERLGISKLVVDRVLQHSLGKVGDTYFVGDDAETRRKAHALVDEHWTASGRAYQLSLCQLSAVPRTPLPLVERPLRVARHSCVVRARSTISTAHPKVPYIRPLSLPGR